MNYYLDAWKKWKDYEGISTRKEYWMFILINSIITFIILAIDKMISGPSPFFTIRYFLLMMVPTIPLITRRLHSIGKSGWWQLISLVPVIGNLWLFILLVKKRKSSIK